jgi:hypothetical protein
MRRTAILLLIWFALAPALHPQDARQDQREACLDVCMHERPNDDLQRQEVVVLEKEGARAIQLGDVTFFRRVYSDDFSAVLSHGETVNKAGWIAKVQTPDIKYESFTASNIQVRLYRDIAVATSTWSMRAVFRGKPTSNQMRAIHVYIYAGGGYRVVTGQTTLLPPFGEQPL